MTRTSRTLCLFLTCCFSSLSARADLLLIDQSGETGRPADILRLDERSGAVLDRISVDTEAVTGVGLTPAGGLIAAGNTLGYGQFFRSLTLRNLEQWQSSHPLTAPGRLKTGPDGLLYILSSPWHNPERGGEVLRFNAESGVFIDSFAQAGTDGRHLVDLTFGPNGNLFVADMQTGVLEFDGRTGAKLRTFVPAGGPNGLRSLAALVFGPDRHLYVASRDANSIFRFDGQTGEYRDLVVPSDSAALNGPTGLAFSGGTLFVTSSVDGTIQRFDAQGKPLGALSHPSLSLRNPRNLIHIPDPPPLAVSALPNGVGVRTRTL